MTDKLIYLLENSLLSHKGYNSNEFLTTTYILLEVTTGKLSAVETLSRYLPPSLQSRRQLISNSSAFLCPSEVRHTILRDLHTLIKEHHKLPFHEAKNTCTCTII